MNRLILLGNGFDLAHGMKTGYNDFIKWYFKKCLSEAQINEPYEDSLLYVKKLDYYFGMYSKTQIDDFIEFLYSIKLSVCEKEFFDEKSLVGMNPYKITIKSELLRKLFDKCSYNTWVEVENEFYEMLRKILHTKEGKEEELRKLNESLTRIIQELETYLSEIKSPIFEKKYKEIFESEILREDIVSDFLDSTIPDSTMILNFNYTSTVEEYIKGDFYYSKIKKIKVNYIHGQLNKVENPVIFGFGDELDEDYNAMELEKTKGFMKYIKSFWYFKASNYHDLLRFIEADRFQIFILGHSCGLSDRTMLNLLFEHKNCESIKIYYYDNGKGYDNYEDLTYEISKHFKDKSKMRRVIVPKNRSFPMPQIEQLKSESV